MTTRGSLFPTTPLSRAASAGRSPGLLFVVTLSLAFAAPGESEARGAEDAPLPAPADAGAERPRPAPLPPPPRSRRTGTGRAGTGGTGGSDGSRGAGGAGPRPTPPVVVPGPRAGPPPRADGTVPAGPVIRTTTGTIRLDEPTRAPDGSLVMPIGEPTAPDFYGAVLGDSFSGPIVGSERVIHAVGGVGQPIWIRQPEFELRCDGVVIWGAAEADKLANALRQRAPEEGEDPRSVLGPVIHAIYAEGDVYLARDGHVVRADRVMVDFARNQATMVNATLRGTITTQDGEEAPLFVRAETVRGLAEGKYRAENASLTTCSYADPHYHFTIDTLDVDVTGEDASFETSWWPTLYADTVFGKDTPIVALPKLGGRAVDLAPLRDVAIGSSDRFGGFVEVLWGADLRDEWAQQYGEWALHTDYRSRRGFGLGLDLELEGPERGRRQERDFLELLTYYQRDSAREDEFSERPFDGLLPGGSTPNDRGRIWGRFRHHGGQGGILPEAWRIQGEVAYWSDRGFVPEYYRSAATTDKPQETYLNARGVWGNQGVSVLASHRIPDEAAALARAPGDLLTTDYAQQVDALPSVTYHLINQPILGLERTGFAPVNLSVQAGVGSFKRRYDHLFEDLLTSAIGWRPERVIRGDVQARVTVPFSLGPVRFVPSLGGSAMAVDDRNGFRTQDNSSEARIAGEVGLRAGTSARRTYDVRSDTLGLEGLRHVVSVDAAFVDRFQTDDRPLTYQQNDLVDELDEVTSGSLRIRNRLQTHRDGELVDWLDYEFRYLHFFDDFQAQPSLFGVNEDLPQPLQRIGFPGQDKYAGVKRDGSAFHQHRLRMFVLPNLWIAGEADYDMEQHRMETSAAGVRWTVDRRLSLYLGRRAIVGDSRIWTLRGDVRLSEKWALSLSTQQNTRNDSRLRTTATLYRRSHDYTIAMELDADAQLDDSSLSFALYPNVWLRRRDPFSKRRRFDPSRLRWYR